MQFNIYTAPQYVDSGGGGDDDQGNVVAIENMFDEPGDQDNNDVYAADADGAIMRMKMMVIMEERKKQPISEAGKAGNEVNVESLASTVVVHNEKHLLMHVILY